MIAPEVDLIKNLQTSQARSQVLQHLTLRSPITQI